MFISSWKSAESPLSLNSCKMFAHSPARLFTEASKTSTLEIHVLSAFLHLVSASNHFLSFFPFPAFPSFLSLGSLALSLSLLSEASSLSFFSSCSFSFLPRLFLLAAASAASLRLGAIISVMSTPVARACLRTSSTLSPPMASPSPTAVSERTRAARARKTSGLALRDNRSAWESSFWWATSSNAVSTVRVGTATL